MLHVIFSFICSANITSVEKMYIIISDNNCIFSFYICVSAQQSEKPPIGLLNRKSKVTFLVNFHQPRHSTYVWAYM